MLAGLSGQNRAVILATSYRNEFKSLNPISGLLNSFGSIFLKACNFDDDAKKSLNSCEIWNGSNKRTGCQRHTTFKFPSCILTVYGPKGTQIVWIQKLDFIVIDAVRGLWLRTNDLRGSDRQIALIGASRVGLLSTSHVAQPYNFHSKLSIEVRLYVPFDRALGLSIGNRQPGFVQLLQPGNEWPKDHEQAIENQFEFGILNPDYTI